MNDRKIMGFMAVALFMIGTVEPITAVILAVPGPLALGFHTIYPYLALVIAVMAVAFALQAVFSR